MKNFNKENNDKLTTDTSNIDNDSDSDNWKNASCRKKDVPNKNVVQHSSLGGKCAFRAGSSGDSSESESLL